MQLRVLASSALLAAALAAQAQAQPTTSSITGRALDATGAVLPGVRVAARHLETGLVREAESGSGGEFVLPAVPVGAYEVTAALAGFRPLAQRVTVVLGEPALLTLVLEPGATDEITVTGDAVSVQTRGGQLSYLVSEKTVSDLPLNGRNYTDLVFLQPGVLSFPHRDFGSIVAHGRAASINGQDPRSNVYLLDGTLQNDFTNGPAGSAASTALGTETVREFRVETNAYSAEFGRNSGGQINVLTKSGQNDWHGSLYEYHRNDALDARNFFDPDQKPDFLRNQFGGTVAGPLRRDRSFFFVGYEGLRERLGRTISTVVPDEEAHQGILPSPGGGSLVAPVSPAVRPYLDEFPLPNGANLGGGLAALAFPFDETVDQDYFQARFDQNLGRGDQLFARYTLDHARQELPTDFPQFPRTFESTNQFLTGEYRRVFSARVLATLRGGWSRTHVGQAVEANTSQPLAAFVPGRESMGDIDVTGIPRFGPQSSAGVQLRQDVYSLAADVNASRGRHLLKAGGLVEHYESDLVNPTFSLGIYTFASLESFLRNRPLRFVGLTPEGDFRRHWPYTLLGLYLQDEWRALERLTLSAGLRLEYQTLPRDEGGRDVALVDVTSPAPEIGDLYRNPRPSVSPRLSFSWDLLGDGKTALRGGYGLYYNTNGQQHLIVTVTNPPFTPRPVLVNPSFPQPNFAELGALSIRPYQWDIETPRVHVFNLNLQRQLGHGTLATIGYAGSRGYKLWRNSDVNVPVPVTLADGTPFYPPTAARPNAAFSSIEQKASNGRSWYDALVFELRRSGRSLSFQSSYTWSRNVDTTQASTFFSDATNGSVSYFPEFLPDYNKGPADYHNTHNWVGNVVWDLPLGRDATGAARALLAGWQIAAIGQLRSGPPLTLFVGANRSRSRWSPSIGPGQGFDRPSLAPGYTTTSAVRGDPDQWFDPAAFVLQPAGTFGDLGRGALYGPDLRSVDLALKKRFPWTRLGPAGHVELRVEAFNVFNRANFGIPSLQAFAGLADNELPLPTLGRIRQTVTSARQIQLGLRLQF
jgi:Carboxypeptidase regulatory-like domain/TonB dependent receptor-like, beta-barrel